ncbi:hypothetical protein PR202_ga28980 [Eleusine coracana subsp. coracana]|uniref:DUF6598 domain-containing protein n=1 Tax=Eleusine coracana subsp. coracana TaxID=191504 RepID=A0AAV5DJZ5_ELECO|nr:hypothetical protein PR202_ga28980 [Eleusine coracana subsp. coracana]
MRMRIAASFSNFARSMFHLAVVLDCSTSATAKCDQQSLDDIFTRICRASERVTPHRPAPSPVARAQDAKSTPPRPHRLRAPRFFVAAVNLETSSPLPPVRRRAPSSHCRRPETRPQLRVPYARNLATARRRRDRLFVEAVLFTVHGERLLARARPPTRSKGKALCQRRRQRLHPLLLRQTREPHPPNLPPSYSRWWLPVVDELEVFDEMSSKLRLSPLKIFTIPVTPLVNPKSKFSSYFIIRLFDSTDMRRHVTLTDEEEALLWQEKEEEAGSSKKGEKKKEEKSKKKSGKQKAKEKVEKAVRERRKRGGALDPYLVLTGPTRAVILMVSSPVLIQAELKVKGTTESEDKDLSYTVEPVPFGNTMYSHLLERDCTTKISTLEFTLGHIVHSVEATIFVRVIQGSWPDGLRGKFDAFATCYEPEADVNQEKIILLDSGGEKITYSGNNGEIELSRSVVSVEITGSLKISVEALKGDNTVAKRTRTFKPARYGAKRYKFRMGFCELLVRVAWSLLSYRPVRRSDPV